MVPTFQSRATLGRPRETTLTPEQAKRYMQLVHLANVNRDAGSASMAWRVLCEEHPSIDWDWKELASKHQLPAVARELARKANALVALHRQGERGLTSKGAYSPGGLRNDAMHATRRAIAGERASWDDATVNFGVVIPWTYGGCKLSEKYGVKLGRFQLLLVHDEATSYVPAWSHVIRESQAYRGTDVAEAVMRVSRDVCLWENLVLEGGVWQGRRMQRVMEGMGTKLISAKGRPQCKMVENYFNRLWTRLGMEGGLASVGRFRGEEKATSDFYVKCRAGGADPRGKFPWLAEAVKGLENAVRFLNADRIESKRYGKWVPEERWQMDMEATPRPVLAPEKLWLAAPVMEKRKVSRSSVSVTTTGPMGMRMIYTFTAAVLWEWEGREVEIYFDPLAEWPLHATIAKVGTAVSIGTAECCNPYHQGGNPDAARASREISRREYRVIWSGGRQLATSRKESASRGLTGVVEVRRDEDTNLHRSGTDQPADREKRLEGHSSQILEPQLNRGGATPPGAGDRGAQVSPLSISPRPLRSDEPESIRNETVIDPLRGLSRKAAAARDLIPNW